MPPRPSWRIGDLVREAVLDTFSVGGRSILALVAAVAISSATAAWAVWETRMFDQTLIELGDRGRNVVVISSAMPDVAASISRGSCESLIDLPGVLRAGVVVQEGRDDVFPFGVDIPLYRVSSTLMPELADAEAVVGSAVADQPGGSAQRISIGDIAVEAVVGERQPTGVDVNSGVSLPASVNQADAENCFVVLDRRADVTSWAPSLVSELKSSGPPLGAIAVLQEPTDARQAYLDRATRFIPLAAGTFVGILFGLLTISRASELATYRLSGTSARDLLVMLSMQSLLVGGIVSASAAVASTPLSPIGADPSVIAMRAIEMGAIAAVVSSLLASSVALRRPTDLAKDR
jgi:hypothetical protein